MDLSIGGGDLGVHLPDLLAAADVTAVQIATFHKEPSFHGDTSTEAAKEITSAARSEHLERHFGFWEYALRSAIDSDSATREYLLRGALRHTSGTDGIDWLTTGEFVGLLRGGRYDDLPERTIVSLTSPVRTQRSGENHWHLPMLDLGARISDEGEQSVVQSLEALQLRGLIFASGRSYHFYGSQPYRETELWRLLGRAQLLSPIVDARWISHQLIDGRCGLRISTDRERHLAPLRYVARLD